MENMLNKKKQGKILSSCTENTLHCSDYNLAYKELDNCQDDWSHMMEETCPG